jgi:hypothetical protein
MPIYHKTPQNQKYFSCCNKIGTERRIAQPVLLGFIWKKKLIQTLMQLEIFVAERLLP